MGRVFGNPVVAQSIKQIGGLMAMAVRYDNKLPDKDNSASANEYALPFAGAWTALNGGVTEEASHSWDVCTQRYAYDFVVLDDEGRTCPPDADPADPASYHCYGLDVLAPADGTVVEAHTGCPDAPVALDGNVACGGDDIRGNFVLIEHAHGEFSCLCHLMPNGVCVRAGDAVARGQVVGRCGSTGNSSEPHLHCHVQLGRSFYSSPGVPIRFPHAEAVPAPHYAAIDPRPVPDGAWEEFPPFVTRGMRVKNGGAA